MFVLKGILYSLFFNCFIDGSTFDDIRIAYEKPPYMEVTFTENPQEYAAFRLEFYIGYSTEIYLRSHDCSTPTMHCRQIEHGTTIMISKINERCQAFNFTTDNTFAGLKAQIDVRKIELYGGAEHAKLTWPSTGIEYVTQAFITTSHNYQAVLEPYWVTSNGYFIYVDKTVPLFLTADRNRDFFTLIARVGSPYPKEVTKLGLHFVVCQFEDPRKAHEYAVEHYLGKPIGIPDERRIKHPIWSTWVKFKDNIDEHKVLQYAKEIHDYGYGGQVEIDDNWEGCYGSMTPNKTRFPKLGELVNTIKHYNLSVNLWVHPFVNTRCKEVYKEGHRGNFYVRDSHGNTAMSWWRGPGLTSNYIDFTNPAAVQWYRKRLENLRKTYGIDSFKFDGGESSYSPNEAQFHVMAEDYPETIVKEYVKTIASFGTNVHTRVARGTQQYPVFVTMMDRESNWSGRLGLKSLIPQLLHMNIIGYSFVLPDMIGGNLYNGEPLDPELFIRWLQANVFMPSLQFSIPPWDYGAEVAALAKKFMDLRERYADRIIELMRRHVETGAPVNPPLWWIAPKEYNTLIIDSEFLLGEDILVAPVLQRGATSRDIFLPAGLWRDENNKKIIAGPCWIYAYQADLNVLPYFTKVSESKPVPVHFISSLSSEDADTKDFEDKIRTRKRSSILRSGKQTNFCTCLSRN